MLTEEVYQKYLQHCYDEKYVYTNDKIRTQPIKKSRRNYFDLDRELIELINNHTFARNEKSLLLDIYRPKANSKDLKSLFKIPRRNTFANAESLASVCEFKLVHHEQLDTTFEMIHPLEFIAYLKHNPDRLKYIISGYAHFMRQYGFDFARLIKAITSSDC